MQKNLSSTLIIVSITFLTLTSISPIINAAVYISPMNILAEANVTEGGFCQVNKTITLRNDANKSAIVNISSSNINVIFENNTIVLLPYEKKTIHPIVIVEQGKKTGKISIKSYEIDESGQTTGLGVSTTLSIKVTSIGTLVNTSSSENNSEYKIDILYYYVFVVIIIVILIIAFILMKKKK